MSTCGSGINKSVIPSDIGHSNSAGRLGPLPWVLTASLILRDPGQAMENKSPFDKTGALSHMSSRWRWACGQELGKLRNEETLGLLAQRECGLEPTTLAKASQSSGWSFTNAIVRGD